MCIRDRDWTDFGIDLILGATCDVEANFEQTMFLPDILSSELEQASLKKSSLSVGLINNKHLVLDHRERDQLRETHSSLRPIVLFSILAFLEFLLLVFRDKLSPTLLKIYDYLWIIILSIASLIMMLMWFATAHVTCSQNWNLLWANPLYIPCLLYTSPSPRDATLSRMPSSA